MKAGFVAATMLLVSNSVAALEVTESARVDAPIDLVWKQVEPFCGISDWHPAVEKCELRRQDGALERVITIKGGGVIEERQLASSRAKRSIEYKILSAPLPVKDYSATVALTPNGKATTIVWKAEFVANGASDAETKKIVSGIFTSGFDGLKQKLRAK